MLPIAFFSITALFDYCDLARANSRDRPIIAAYAPPFVRYTPRPTPIREMSHNRLYCWYDTEQYVYSDVSVLSLVDTATVW